MLQLTAAGSARLVHRIGRGLLVNPLGQALRALGKAIQARRRLLRMAPEVFGAAVAQRPTDEHRPSEHSRREREAALEKVYGKNEPHSDETGNRCGNGAETVQFSRRQRQWTENTSLEYDLWMAAGREAFARYQWLQPHRRLSLRTAARLIDVASVFGRLACGMELQPPGQPKMQGHPAWRPSPSMAHSGEFMGAAKGVSASDKNATMARIVEECRCYQPL